MIKIAKTCVHNLILNRKNVIELVKINKNV